MTARQDGGAQPGQVAVPSIAPSATPAPEGTPPRVIKAGPPSGQLLLQEKPQ